MSASLAEQEAHAIAIAEQIALRAGVPRAKRSTSLDLPKPHAAQQQIIHEAKRFNVLSCGRRFGKTLLGIELASIAREGYPVAWFSPTYKMLAEVWRDMRRLFFPVVTNINQQQHRLELGSGSVDMWSLDSPDSCRGRKYKRVIVDEAAMVPNFKEAWDAAIYPTLTDLKGDGFWLSTPRGMNFFKQGFDYGQDPFKEDWASWSFPTSANPFMPPEEIEMARDNLPEMTFRQEYLAEFLQSEGAVFRNIEPNLTDERTTPRDHADHKIAAGLDLAKKEDFTVLSILCVTCKRELALERFNQVDYMFQVKRVVALLRLWGAQTVAVDATGVGDAVIEFLDSQLRLADTAQIVDPDQPSHDGLGKAQ